MRSKIHRSAFLLTLIILIGIVATVIVSSTLNSRLLKDEILRDEKITVELSKSVHAEQLAFENDLVRVSVGCDQYLAYLNLKLNDPSLSDTLRVDSSELRKSIEATNSCVGKGIVLHEHSVADMLEHGSASVYDKRNETEVSRVQVWYYDFSCGPFCGGGGRTFYLLDGLEFLQVQDWIS